MSSLPRTQSVPQGNLYSISDDNYFITRTDEDMRKRVIALIEQGTAFVAHPFHGGVLLFTDFEQYRRYTHAEYLRNLSKDKIGTKTPQPFVINPPKLKPRKKKT